MFPRIKNVRHIADYRLELIFTDGTVGELDFRQSIVGRGGVFRPLEDVGFFRQVKVDPEAGTIVWPNEVDFCPDVLYGLVTGKPIGVAKAVTDRPSSGFPPAPESASEDFEPVEIRGESLSTTILRERR